MGSPFQRAFSSKSPLNQHKEVKKLLRQAKRENPQDRSYEKIADLETEFANAKLAHKDNSSKKQDVTIVEKERDNSMADASMSRKASPLDGKINYTLDGKPLTEAQTGYDPSKLISDQSNAQDKIDRAKYRAEKKKKDQAKPRQDPPPKPKNKRNQAMIDARKAKGLDANGKKSTPKSKDLIAARDKKIAEEKAKKK